MKTTDNLVVKSALVRRTCDLLNVLDDIGVRYTGIPDVPGVVVHRFVNRYYKAHIESFEDLAESLKEREE